MPAVCFHETRGKPDSALYTCSPLRGWKFVAARPRSLDQGIDRAIVWLRKLTSDGETW